MNGRRGRPRKPRSEIVRSNGLLPRQWARLRKESKKLGYTDVTPYLRQIVDEYFAQRDAEEAAAEDNASGDAAHERLEGLTTAVDP